MVFNCLLYTDVQEQLEGLRRKMDPTSSGVVLWTDFWSAIMEFVGAGTPVIAPAPAPPPPPPMPTAFSDEDFARLVQEDLDAGGTGDISAILERMSNAAAAAPAPAPAPIPAPVPVFTRVSSMMGEPPDVFDVYHYNGLLRPRHGVIQPPSFVRATINTTVSSAIDPGVDGINAVLDTRWANALVAWEGGHAPSIEG